MTARRDWLVYGAGVAVGLIIGIASMPIPEQPDSCSVYKVDKKLVTSYALMPPPPIIRPAACPAAPKCESAKTEVFVSNAEANKDEEVKEDKPRHHRHHRNRRYWR